MLSKSKESTPTIWRPPAVQRSFKKDFMLIKTETGKTLEKLVTEAFVKFTTQEFQKIVDEGKSGEQKR